jgi:hypothetical protein
MRRIGWILLCSLALPDPAGAQLAPRLLRGPYLQLGTPTSVVVRWRTDLPTDSRVRYGTSPGALNGVASDPLPATDHQVRLSGLSPATRYYYSVGSATQTLSGGVEDTFLTAPPLGVARQVRIWAFGDAGADDSHAGQFRVVDSYLAYSGGGPADVWLMLGDQAYLLANDQDYQEDFFAIYPGLLRQSVTWPAFGNHEAFSSNSETALGPYYDLFSLPTAGEAGGVPSGTEAYYSFDYANIHFIVLNTEMRDLSRTGPMLTWLRRDLAADARQWTIVTFHRPPYTRGSHNSDNPIDDESTAFQDIRQNILPMLEESGVDLVLTGHSHSYERSYLLDGHYGLSSTFTESMKLDPGDGSPDGDGAYLKTDDIAADAHDGTVYAVVGTGGQNLGGTLDHPAMVASVGDFAGSLLIDISGKRLDAVFLDERGQIRDHFSIVKGNANVAPDAVDDRTTTQSGVPVTLDVLANDRDRNHDPLTVDRVDPPTHGTATANADGTVTYTPAPGFTGVDSFPYRVSDGRGGHGRATVTVSVTCPPAVLFSDDLEPAADPGWTVETAANLIPASSPWTVRDDEAAHSPQRVWFSDAGFAAVNKDDRLISPPLDLSTVSRLLFWHRFDLEASFDGGVLEISTDGGQTWTDLGPQMVVNGYNGRIPTDNPLGARPAWTGTSNGTGMVRVEVDLGPWAGPGRRIRWRLGCDSLTAEVRTGWLVDDVEVADFPLACPGG